jgi:hypothetical protein
MENHMELEEIKALWTQTDRKLEASMRLNTALLAQWNLRTTDTSLKRLSREILFEMIVNVIGIALLGLFAAAHLREPQFLIPAVALDIYAIALVIAGGRQLAEIAAVDYDEPVVTIQKKLEELRLQRIRATLWTLLFAPLMWVPLLIVAVRGIFGVDVYAAGWAWLAANVLFGLAVIPLAIFIAKRYGARLARYTPMRALADTIAGRSLAAALVSLDAIRRFETDTALA